MLAFIAHLLMLYCGKDEIDSERDRQKNNMFSGVFFPFIYDSELKIKIYEERLVI